MIRLGLLTAAASLAAAPLLGQSLASRVDAVREGTIEMTFASRPDVCGDGRGSIWTTRGGGYNSYECVHGPVRVTIGRSDGQTVSIRSCVACRPRTDGATQFGDVPADEVARYLLTVAVGIGGTSADKAVSAAALADANVGAELAQLARNENATISSRKQALFWFGQSDAPTKDLIALDHDLTSETLRKQYVFVLSQRHDDAA